MAPRVMAPPMPEPASVPMPDALPGGSILGKPVGQVALIVKDAEASAHAYWEHLGIGPWRIFTIGAPTVRDMSYRGKPADWRIRYALTFSGDLSFEVIEPLDGPSIWHEYMDRRGPSLHHIAFYVDDFDAAAGLMRAKGWESVQEGHGFGRSQDGRIIYYEHGDAIGCIVEIIKAPTVRDIPELIIPAPADA